VIYFRWDFREAIIKALIFRLRLNDRKDPAVRRSEEELSRRRECPVQSPEDTNKHAALRARGKAH